jgi:hypothetical protein
MARETVSSVLMAEIHEYQATLTHAQLPPDTVARAVEGHPVMQRLATTTANLDLPLSKGAVLYVEEAKRLGVEARHIAHTIVTAAELATAGEKGKVGPFGEQKPPFEQLQGKIAERKTAQAYQRAS